MKDKILFVTKGGETCDEGLSYVLELAGTLNAGIEVLIMSPDKISSQLESLMEAAAFAEEGDRESAIQAVQREQCECRGLLEEKIGAMMKSSKEAVRGSAIDLVFHLSDGDISAEIRKLLKERKNIDMVLLSPSLSEHKKTFDIRKLIKIISKPIVNISRPATARI